VTEEREGVAGSSRTNLCREWSSCSRDGQRGQIHVSSWPEVAGSSSWSGTSSKDLRQPSLGWRAEDVTMPVTASSWPSSRREWWDCRRAELWRDRAAKASGERAAKASGESAGVVDMSSEEPNMNDTCISVWWNYWRDLDGSVLQLEFLGHYSQYRWEILSSPCMVCLLTLTSGPLS
jgi:hypothetical protein